MELSNDFQIQRLTLANHRILLKNLKRFWLSKTEYVKPLHHPVFSLLYSDFSSILFHKSEPVSYIYAAHNNSKGFIHVMATLPEFYRHGFASLLLRHLETKARSKKLRSIWAYMLPENSRSELFFKHHGFIIRKEIRVSSDDFRILYRKSL